MIVVTTCEECFKSFRTDLKDYSADMPITCQDCLDLQHEPIEKEEHDTTNRCIYK